MKIQEMVDGVIRSYLSGSYVNALLYSMRLNGAMPIELHTVLDIIDGKEPDDGFLNDMYRKYYGIRIDRGAK